MLYFSNNTDWYLDVYFNDGSFHGGVIEIISDIIGVVQRRKIFSLDIFKRKIFYRTFNFCVCYLCYWFYFIYYNVLKSIFI